MTFFTPPQPPADYMAQTYDLSFRDHILFEKALRDKRVPSVRDVLVAEETLSKSRCIGRMARWHRVFSYGRDARTLRLDTSLIAFTFTQAGLFGRQPDRRITTLGGSIDGPDDRQFLMANGVYSIRTHLATVTFCGYNRQ